MVEVSYSFTQLNDKHWKIFNDRSMEQYLEKWYLKNGLQVSFWAFNQPYQPHNTKELVLSLIQQPAAHCQLPWPIDEKVPATVEPVPSGITSLEFFDRILDPANGVVRRGSDGETRGCFEETFNEFTVADELRQMLLNEDSETYPLYSHAERRELLFQFMQHVVLGGQWCQYEDKVKPYIEVATAMYKDFLSVQKNQDSGNVEIRSKCFRLVPPESRSLQDFVYISVDPGLREITLLTHRF